MHTSKKFHLLLLILLTLCWGPAFFFIKVALAEVSIVTIATARIGLAALLLYILTKIQKMSLLKWRGATKHFIVMSLIATIIPTCFTNYAETMISSSLAGILNASQPIFAAVLAHYILETERFNIKSLLGIGIGFSGILCIFLPSVLATNTHRVWGILIMTLGALSNASSAVYAKRFLSQVPSIVSATYQFALGTMMILPWALIAGGANLLHIPSLKVILCLVALGVFGSGCAYIIFYYLVKHAGATYVSTVSLLLPFIAILLGISILHETLYWTAYIGCVLILVGLVITNSLFSLKPLKNLFKRKENKTDTST